MKFKNPSILNVLTCISVCAFLSACVSCKSLGVEPEVYEPLDYTVENVVQEELKRLEDIAQKDPVKALWRAALLEKNTAFNEEAVKACDFYAEKSVELYNAALLQNNFNEARRIYISLKSLDRSEISLLEFDENQLAEKERAKLPVLKTASDSEDVKVAGMISGTVTVYVDKGIKVENGMGYADAVLGSGFFITDNGYIITNHHVIADCVDPSYEGYTRLYIKLAEDSDTRIPAVVVGWDPIMDLALLKAEIDSPYFFELGSSENLEAGDRVYAIGSPLGLERTLTSGIISSTDRRLFTTGKVFQLDAAVNSGNSGGPMIDEKGRVQAVVFASVLTYQGLNFAIPVEYLKFDLPFLFEGGKRTQSWTGSFGKTKRLSSFGAKNEGVQLYYTMPGSPSDLAGLKENDTIVEVNGIKIESLDDLHNLYMQNLKGTVLKFKAVDEEGNEKQCAVYLDERTETPGYSIYRHDLAYNVLYPVLGMKLSPSSSTNKNMYTVTRVIKGSSAEENGFSEGDPVQLVSITMNEDNTVMYVVLYAKKQKSGYIDLSIGIPVSMDSPYYF